MNIKTRTENEQIVISYFRTIRGRWCGTYAKPLHPEITICILPRRHIRCCKLVFLLPEATVTRSIFIPEAEILLLPEASLVATGQKLCNNRKRLP